VATVVRNWRPLSKRWFTNQRVLVVNVKFISTGLEAEQGGGKEKYTDCTGYLKINLGDRKGAIRPRAKRGEYETKVKRVHGQDCHYKEHKEHGKQRLK